MHVGGMVLSAGEIVVMAPNTTQHDRTSGPCDWTSISFSTADLAAAAQAILGYELAPASVTHLVRPDSEHRTRLNDLLENAIQFAGTTPGLFACPDVVHELEQELIHAMINCLSDSAPVAEGRAANQHSRVIERFEAVLAANPGRPLYLAEICAANGVSERTLRVCCHDHFGMGPIQYFHLRRMHLAHRALLLAEPKGSTVTKIATNFGFCELGRFSVEYRSLFGESPSTSLHRLPDEPRCGRRAPAPAGNEAGSSVAR